MPSSFIRVEGRSITPCALVQSAPTTWPYFPSVRGRSPCVVFDMPAIDILTFYSSRRSRPVRINSPRQRLSHACEKPSDLFTIVRKQLLQRSRNLSRILHVLAFLS